jgi:hypothetical protein
MRSFAASRRLPNCLALCSTSAGRRARDHRNRSGSGLYRPFSTSSETPPLLIDLGLHEAGEVFQGFLPAEVAGLQRDDVGEAGLDDGEVRAAGDLAEVDCDLDLARQVGIVELVRVAQALARHELQVLAAEGMAAVRGEVAERHPEGAADPGLKVMDGAGEAVGRQPLRQRVRFDEGAVDLLGLGREDAVQANGVGHGSFLRTSG